jgi:hypothetical protein
VLADELLDLHAEPGAGRPARVVGQEDRDLAQLVRAQLGGAQRGADLDVGDVLQALAGQQAEQQQPAVPRGR